MGEGRHAAKEFLGKFSYRYIWKTLELATIILLANILPLNEFAKASLFAVMIFIFSSFFKPGAAVSKDKAKDYYSALSFITPIFGIMIATSCFFISLVIDKSYFLLVNLFGIVLLIGTLVVSPESFYSLNGEYRRIYKAYSFAQGVFMISALVLSMRGFGAQGVMLGYIIYYLILACTFWPGFVFRPKLDFDLNRLQVLAGDFISNFKNSFFPVLLNQGILLLVFAYFGLVAFSSFYLAFALSFFLYDNVTLFVNSLLLPKFKLNSEKDDQLRFSLIRTIEYFALFIIPVSAILISLSNEMIHEVIGDNILLTSDILIPIVLAGALKGIFEAGKLILIAKTKTKALQRIRSIEITAFLFSIILFTRLFSVFGVSLSILISSALSSFLFISAACHYLKLDIFMLSRDYYYILISGVITGLLLGLLKEMFIISNLLSVVLLIFAGAIIYIAGIFVFNKEIGKRAIRFFFSLLEK